MRYTDKIIKILERNSDFCEKARRQEFIPDMSRNLLGEEIEISIDFLEIKEEKIIKCFISVCQISHWTFVFKSIIPFTTSFDISFLKKKDF